MDAKLIHDLEQALRDEYKQKHEGLDAELQKKLNALRFISDRPQIISGSITVQLPVQKAPDVLPVNGDAPASNEVPSAMKAARAAIDRMAGKFSVRDLVPVIRKMYPRMDVATGDLSNPMWKLAKDGVIEIVEGGVGRDPHVYRKK